MHRPTWLFAAICATGGAVIATTVLGVLGITGWDIHIASGAAAAWVQAIFSVIGIFTAILVARDQRESDREIAKAGVRPRLNFATYSSPGVISLTLENNGLGPAIIRDVAVSFDGKQVSDISNRGVRTVLASTGIPAEIVGVGMPGRGQSFRAGASEVVIRMQPTLAATDERIRDCFDRLTIEVVYLSLYGERFVVDTTMPDESKPLRIEPAGVAQR